MGSWVLAFGLIALTGSPVQQAPPLTWQQERITASDAEAFDSFGASVALRGDTLLVGAPGQSAAAGAAYVFRHRNGRWSEEARLTARDGQLLDMLGTSVALGGDRALVGAPGRGRSGRALIYRRSGTAWQLEVELSPPGSGDLRFGYAVALDGDGARAVIGAPTEESPKGPAYLFERTDDGWKRTPLIPRAPEGSGIGRSVAINGELVAVGGMAKTWLFERRDTWVESARFRSPVHDCAGSFGHDLAIAPGRLLVSVGMFDRMAPEWCHPEVEALEIDAAWLRRDGLAGQWQAGEHLVGKALEPVHQPAHSLDFDGDVAALGYPTSRDLDGEVSVFLLRGGAWLHAATLTPAATAGDTGFGGSLDVDASRIAIGAHRDSGEATDAGAVHVFERTATP